MEARDKTGFIFGVHFWNKGNSVWGWDKGAGHGTQCVGTKGTRSGREAHRRGLPRARSVKKKDKWGEGQVEEITHLEEMRAVRNLSGSALSSRRTSGDGWLIETGA